MSFSDFFSAQAGSYAQFRPRYPAALYRALVAHAPHRRLAWDVGTGNGQAAIDLARDFEHVRATDASAAQLERAVAHERVAYAVRPAEDSGLADGSVALITAAQCLHWFATPGFYAEVRRVLARGGVFAAWAYAFHRSDDARLDGLIQRFGVDVLAEFWPPETLTIRDGYRDLPFPFEPVAMPAFELEVSWTLHELVGYFATWSATQRFIEARGHHPLEPMFDDLAAAWGDPDRPRRLACPLVLRAGRVT